MFSVPSASGSSGITAGPDPSGKTCRCLFRRRFFVRLHLPPELACETTFQLPREEPRSRAGLGYGDAKDSLYSRFDPRNSRSRSERSRAECENYKDLGRVLRISRSTALYPHSNISRILFYPHDYYPLGRRASALRSLFG